MDQELTTSLDLLRRRLALMRELANSLAQVQTAVVRSDRNGIEDHTARQRDLCQALRQLGSEALGCLPEKPIGGESRTHKLWAQLGEVAVSPQVRQRWEILAGELNQVEMQVSQLNRVYGALLRRAQHTLQIFMRVLASSANTYAPPKCGETTVPSAFREVSHV